MAPVVSCVPIKHKLIINNLTEGTISPSLPPKHKMPACAGEVSIEEDTSQEERSIDGDVCACALDRNFSPQSICSNAALLKSTSSTDAQ